MDISGTPVSLRIDFLEKQTFQQILVSYFGNEFYSGTFGIEDKNKYGQTIKTHMHYNFIYPADVAETQKYCAKLRKRIQRDNEDRGRGYYAIKLHLDIENYERWFGYVYKQYEFFEEIPTFRIPPPTGLDQKLAWRIAHEEWENNKHFLSLQREKADRKQTTYAKMLEKINEDKLIFISLRKVFEFIMEYYQTEQIPVERHKIKSMVDSIGLYVGLISRDEYYDMAMSS